LTGNIDEVKIWDVQRSQCDIIANMYNSVPTSYPSSLKCYYKFNDNSGSSPANSVSGGPTGSFSSAAPSWDSNVAPIDPSCTSGCRLANATGIKENWNNGSLKVYPNPNSGNFTVEINTAVRQNVKIYDVTGAVVLDQVVDGKTNINAGNLNAGIYTISITGKDGAVTQKLIIMK
ncbi:MAG: T9SS type A sorting domain-containing protein, partial [Bacteroidia bacterium]